jgi:hypothetical protein
MKTPIALTFIALTGAIFSHARAAEFSLDAAPPVVVRTAPTAGIDDVDPALKEIRVTFSKGMQDGSWSWSTWSKESFPETTGDPRYLEDGRTCVLPVKLQTGTFYAIWLNSERFKGFKDREGRSAVPYLLTFTTGRAKSPAEPSQTPVAPEPSGKPSAALPNDKLLNAEQKLVLEWTDRRFGSYFDARTFEGMPAQERADLEKRTLDALKGPKNREYYQAINTVAALRSAAGLKALREIAFDRREKDNRDRWMAVRALGMIGEESDVPELIHLVYHGNTNTRWWSQISLVRLTGQNFGNDWNAWGKWWNGRNSQPPFKPEMVRWWSGQAESDKLAETLAESDQKFFEGLKKSSATR